MTFEELERVVRELPPDSLFRLTFYRTPDKWVCSFREGGLGQAENRRGHTESYGLEAAIIDALQEKLDGRRS